jgi:hypothetical protein
MKPLIRFILLTLFIPATGFAQDIIKQRVDSLQYVQNMPYLCGGGYISGCASQIYWDVIVLKEAAIPYLIDKLDDSTTTYASVSLLGIYYTTADVAYWALQEIIHGIPTLQLMGLKTDATSCNFCMYWDYLRKDYRNRLKFRKAVHRWYKKNKQNMVWVVSNKFENCDCGTKHPNGGHYEVHTGK